MKNLAVAVASIAILAFLCALSWCVTVGILYLISIFFSLGFSLLWATGIWMVLWLVKGLASVKIEK